MTKRHVDPSSWPSRQRVRTFVWNWLTLPSTGLGHLWRFDGERRAAISMCGVWLIRRQGSEIDPAHHDGPDTLAVPKNWINGLPAVHCKQCARLAPGRGHEL